MKKIILTILSILCSIILSNNNPKIALVLSGGGAKGIAQIPTLQLIDSLNIPIDIVVGTSMGSITGATFAIGYSPDEIRRKAFLTNWDLIFSNNKHRKDLYFFQKNDYDKYRVEFELSGIKPQAPMALINGHGSYIHINEAIGIYETVNDFNNLPIPFRCNAVDLLSGNEIVFKQGSLSKSLRASSSIPSIFSPVKDNELLLVDGGVVNNFPADIADRLDADIIIGVNVAVSKKNMNDINNFVDVLSQSILLNGFKKRLDNLYYTDILIEPDVLTQSTLGFEQDDLKKLYNIGYKAAQNKLNELIKIKESLQLDSPTYINLSSIKNEIFTINDISINSKDHITINDIFKNNNLPYKTSKNDFLDFMLNLRASNQYINIQYKLYPYDKDVNQYSLHLNIEKAPKIIIHDIIVKGNIKLSKSFIKNIINVKSGDYLDVNILRKNIDNAYNLDYFENIRYEIENIDNNTNLIIIVNESTKNKMKLSGEWHNYYKLIGNVKFDLINKPLKKFRITNQTRFGNTIAENHIDIFYIKNFNYLSKFIPVIKLTNIKNKVAFLDINNSIIKQTIYNRDYSLNTIFSLKEYGFINLGIHNQKIEYEDTYNNETLNYYSANINIDQIDNLLYPKSGFLYDISLEINNEEYNYYISSLTFDHYFSFSSNYRMKLYGDLMISNLNELDSHKLIIKNINYIPYDRTLTFSQYNLFANELLSYGLEFDFDYKNSTTFRFIINHINNTEFKQSSLKFNNIYSYGLGFRIKSLLGPFNFMWTYTKEPILNLEQKNYFFSLGIDI